MMQKWMLFISSFALWGRVPRRRNRWAIRLLRTTMPKGRLVGLEILDASELLGEERGRLMLEITPALVTTTA
jgi:hypothetical protein